LPGIGGPSRELVSSDDAGTCARRQPLERALSDLPQIPAPGRGVSATSQPVREVGSSIPTVQLLFQTHARGDEILPWQNDRNNREPTCGNEPREIGNRSWPTLAPFSFFISSKAQPCPCAAYHIHLVVRWYRPPRSRTLGGSVPWGKACGGASRQTSDPKDMVANASLETSRAGACAEGFQLPVTNHPR
jgi:hypothetical protein